MLCTLFSLAQEHITINDNLAVELEPTIIKGKKVFVATLDMDGSITPIADSEVVGHTSGKTDINGMTIVHFYWTLMKPKLTKNIRQ